MDWLQPVRQAKHSLFVARKRLRRVSVTVKDAAFTVFNAAVPYRFDMDRHRTKWGEFPRMYFLHRDPPAGTRTDAPVPRVIYAVWTGTNELTPNRRRGLESLRALNPDTPVVLVTPDNLDDFVVPGHPIHPAYVHLSLNHRSDYLRAYLMHHHGGGYSDIKVAHSSWDRAFETFLERPETWVVGYQELGSDRCGGRDAHLGHEIRRRYRALVGFGAFICRPQTPLTAEWIRELDRRLDYYADELRECPGDMWGENRGYPILWIELGSDIFNPLQLKYLTHIAQDQVVLPQLTDHR